MPKKTTKTQSITDTKILVALVALAVAGGLAFAGTPSPENQNINECSPIVFQLPKEICKNLGYEKVRYQCPGQKTTTVISYRDLRERNCLSENNWKAYVKNICQQSCEESAAEQRAAQERRARQEAQRQQTEEPEIDDRIFLNDCGLPEGGWQDGGHYVLNRNIQFIQNEDAPSSCFFIRASNVTLDGNGKTIYLNPEDPRIVTGVGIGPNNLENITIKNLTIVGFNTGIKLSWEGQHVINNAILNSGIYSPSTNIPTGITVGGQNHEIRDNKVCGSSGIVPTDILCLNGNNYGSGNIFTNISDQCDNWPRRSDYTRCE
jgi:hypothetical protein